MILSRGRGEREKGWEGGKMGVRPGSTLGGLVSCSTPPPGGGAGSKEAQGGGFASLRLGGVRPHHTSAQPFLRLSAPDRGMAPAHPQWTNPPNSTADSITHGARRWGAAERPHCGYYRWIKLLTALFPPRRARVHLKDFQKSFEVQLSVSHF